MAFLGLEGGDGNAVKLLVGAGGVDEEGAGGEDGGVFGGFPGEEV